MERLRCLSFNLWKNEGRFEERLEKLLKLLPEIDADVIALQECFVAPDLKIDVAASIARACGLHLTRGELRQKTRLHDKQDTLSRSDMAILSRAAPETIELIHLPTDSRDGERALLLISLPFANELLHIGCTHLTHLRDAAGQRTRMAQAHALADMLSNRQPSTTILLGDLNARAGDVDLDPIMARRRLHPVSAALAVKAQCAISPADGSLDHILLYSSDNEQWTVSRDVILPPDEDDPDAGPSDHPAILADLVRA
jgi:endonuclease/exonuclease/phosphatase family metal-dependent hydrolase